MDTKFWEQNDKGNLKGVSPVKEETRCELDQMFWIDTSGSMGASTRVVGETGEEKSIPKIDQVNEGFKMAHKSMLRFMQENTRFYIKYQLIELNTYCKAMFNTYKNIDDDSYNLSEVNFTADGVTNIEALFNTSIQFINKKHLGNYNRALNIIMMSDGIPTDVNGFALSEAKWKKIVDKFKAYLDEHGYSRNVEFYFIAIGDEAEPFGRYFAGDDHFYKVEDCESISEKFDFVTRQTLADSTTSSVPYIDFSFGEDSTDDSSNLDNGDSDDDNDNKNVLGKTTQNLLNTVSDDDQTNNTQSVDDNASDDTADGSLSSDDNGLDFYNLYDDDGDDGEGGAGNSKTSSDEDKNATQADDKQKTSDDELSDLLSF